jgi:P-type E1-E2 ATPase
VLLENLLRFEDGKTVTRENIVAVAAWAAGDLLTAVAVPLTLLAGHVFEERSMRGSRAAIAALEGLRRSQARRVRGDVREEVDSDQLQIGDEVELLPGDAIPADGRIVSGRSHVASAAVTGESLPVSVGPGDSVLAGGVNHEGVLRLVVDRAGQETVLGAVQRLLTEAENLKPAAVRVLERYAGTYLPLVLIVAMAAGFASGSLSTALAVIVAACPCALALAAPALVLLGVFLAWPLAAILDRSLAIIAGLLTVTLLGVVTAGIVGKPAQPRRPFLSSTSV